MDRFEDDASPDLGEVARYVRVERRWKGRWLEGANAVGSLPLRFCVLILSFGAASLSTRVALSEAPAIGDHVVLCRKSPPMGSVEVVKERSLRSRLHRLSLQDQGRYRFAFTEARSNLELSEVPSGTPAVLVSLVQEDLPLRTRSAQIEFIGGTRSGMRGWCGEEDLLTPAAWASLLSPPKVDRTATAATSRETQIIGPLSKFAGKPRYRAVNVGPGPSVEIRWKGRTYPLTLLGIDAPRIEARRFVQKVLNGRDVYLQYDPEQRRDRNGKPSPYIYRDDGMFINLELVSRGLAVVAEPPGALADLFLDAQMKAREAEKGLWADGRSPTDGSYPSREYLANLATTRSKGEARHAREQAAKAANRATRERLMFGMMGGPGNMGGLGSSGGLGGGMGGGFASQGGYYVGPRQPSGYYVGGVGSSHRGGHYVNSFTGNHYQRRR